LIHALVAKFDPINSAEVHENAAQALVDIILVSMNSASSPLIAQLESQEVLEKLFQHILTDVSLDVSVVCYRVAKPRPCSI
jgi:hypothetical protein